MKLLLQQLYLSRICFSAWSKYSNKLYSPRVQQSVRRRNIIDIFLFLRTRRGARVIIVYYYYYNILKVPINALWDRILINSGFSQRRKNKIKDIAYALFSHYNILYTVVHIDILRPREIRGRDCPALSTISKRALRSHIQYT